LAIGHENNEVIIYFNQQDCSDIDADWYYITLLGAFV